MPRYRIDSIADFAAQMRFTPLDQRALQINHAEELLHSLSPNKAYPLDFVIFKITGYHPHDVPADLLTGIALQHDLGLLIEQVSDSLDHPADAVGEPVLSIDEVSERFNVTSKTIQRWRRRGLPARRFIYPDGKRRVGFFVSSVERFLSAHSDQVSRGANFSQVDEAERTHIIRSARRLAVTCQCCDKEISRRIARKLNRSPLTILHTIRKHDELNPDQAIFPRAAEPVSSDDRLAVIKGHRRGLAISTMARRMCRPRSVVYRVVIEERFARLARRKIKFIDDPIYHGEGAEQAVREIVAAQPLPEPQKTDDRVPRDLPPYLRDLYRTPLLGPARERALFLEFNYHKFQFVHLRRRIEEGSVKHRDLNLLEGHLRRATEVKNAIVRHNLRLVVSVARKHLRPALNLMELISDGNITLMRAVEGFDLHKGFRFSTYATLALMKGFARSVPDMLAARTAPGGEDARLDFLPARNDADSDRFVDREQVGKLLAVLNERERTIVTAHFGLATDGDIQTYEQVGQRLGLSKQRVRQIELAAIAKLRAAAQQSN